MADILVIDNYDSFTWNLVHYLMELGAEVQVVRNDAISAGQAKREENRCSCCVSISSAMARPSA